ncbi:MAG: T9SS type A sorting domain-containing protein, partial [Cyclobacteriaceae bacterium]
CSVRRFRASGRDIYQDGTWELLAYVETNDNGEFEFNFLPPGLYRFNIEFPGIPMDPDSFVEFEIGGNGFDANNFKLEAFITENGIEVTRVGLLSIYNQGFKSLSIYPNPTSDFLTIAYDRLLSEDYVVEIHNLQGQLLIQEKLNDGFDQKLKIQVSHLESGVYLATFKQLGGRNATLSMKIVIKH